MIAWITNPESKTLGEMVEYNMANQKFLKKTLYFRKIETCWSPVAGKSFSYSKKIILLDLKSLLALKYFTDRRKCDKCDPLKCSIY